ncbi:MAG: hypothetical protein IJ305_07150, partial [Oscillospiraceae bacterium]|nr:hypothetical protein [Oscillospiraceae bacterium]
MSLHPNAEKQAENVTCPEKKKITFESAMVDIGTLVTYICSAAVRRTLGVAGSAAKKIKSCLVPFGKKAADASVRKIKSLGIGFVRFVEGISAAKDRFAERKAESGFGRAFLAQLSDIGTAVKNNKNFTRTVINYTVPALSIALLVGVVAEKTSADYGVSVEYNGQEIGVVSEESVIANAQQVVADRATYYDTDSETYITATLSLKPLGAQDEVIDEQMLADVIEEQIIETMPAETAEEPVEEPAADLIESNEGKERAYVITIDGEFVGAVTDNTAIENFLETKKAEYTDEGVIDIGFDKNIEYTY